MTHDISQRGFNLIKWLLNRGPQIEEEVGGELKVDRVDEGKGEDRNVDVDDGSVSPGVPRYQLFGIIPAELEVCAVYLVRPNLDQ